LPSADTLACDLALFYDVTKATLKVYLQAIPESIHLGLDGWKSPHKMSFLGATLHFYKEGKMEKFILEFIWCILNSVV
ncbi:hypothetical protein K439DRAFT_1346799, partial [Ramaria rubella]